MFASLLDTVVPLLIFAGFALVSYFLKKRARQEDQDDFGSPPGTPPRPRRTGEPVERRKTWEEELRELLENRQPPPPVVREAAPPPPPIVFTPERRVEAPPPLIEAHRHWQESERSESEGVTPALARFADSSDRLEQAAHLEERVAHHFQQVMHRHVAYATARRAVMSEDAKQAIAMIRNPRTVRSAIIASLILSPPPALAEPR